MILSVLAALLSGMLNSHHEMLSVFYFHLRRLFEMGFSDQLQEILRRLPESRQTLLFSATLPKMLVEFARAGECAVMCM